MAALQFSFKEHFMLIGPGRVDLDVTTAEGFLCLFPSFIRHDAFPPCRVFIAAGIGGDASIVILDQQSLNFIGSPFHATDPHGLLFAYLLTHFGAVATFVQFLGDMGRTFELNDELINFFDDLGLFRDRD
nr:hypothetical protein [Cerasicoccus sp. TK19100]